MLECIFDRSDVEKIWFKLVSVWLFVSVGTLKSAARIIYDLKMHYGIIIWMLAFIRIRFNQRKIGETLKQIPKTIGNDCRVVDNVWVTVHVYNTFYYPMANRESGTIITIISIPVMIISQCCWQWHFTAINSQRNSYLVFAVPGDHYEGRR